MNIDAFPGISHNLCIPRSTSYSSTIINHMKFVTSICAEKRTITTFSFVINIIVVSERQQEKGISLLTSCAFIKAWRIGSHHFSMRRVLHSPHTSWLNLTVLNPTAPCCIMANLYLSPPAWRTDLPRRQRTIRALPGLSCSTWSSSRYRLQLTGCHGCKQRTCSLNFLCECVPRPSIHPLNNS